MSAVFFLGLALTVHATPIRPTPAQILKDAKPPGQDIIPARAGWNGPETKSVSVTNTFRERFSPEAQERENWDSLMSLMIPDLRLWGMLAMLIIGIRLLLSKSDASKPEPVVAKQPGTKRTASHLRAA
jgi:hypothetical protein